MSKVVAVESIRRSKSVEGLSNAFAAAARPFGIDAFAFGRAPASGGLGQLSLIRWPNWIEYYAINGFAQHDSAIDEMQTSREPFTWTELKRRRPEKGARVFEACSRFGWNDGFIVPVDGRGASSGFVSLAAPSSLQSWDGIGQAEITELSRAAYARSLALAADLQDTTSRLSAREQEALSLVAHGRNDADIAVIMRISSSTAHAHVERAKRRLGAKTRAQAVALALRAKMI